MGKRHLESCANREGRLRPFPRSGNRPGVYAGLASNATRLCAFSGDHITPVHGRPARRGNGRPVNGPDNTYGIHSVRPGVNAGPTTA